MRSKQNRRFKSKCFQHDYRNMNHESKTLTKHLSCECKCKFDGRKCSSNQNWNNDKYLCECKNPKEHNMCEKDYIWNPATSSSKNGKF